VRNFSLLLRDLWAWFVGRVKQPLSLAARRDPEPSLELQKTPETRTVIRAFTAEVGREGGLSKSPKKVRAARRNLAKARRIFHLTLSQKRRREGQLRRGQTAIVPSDFQRRSGSKKVETQDSSQDAGIENPLP